MLGNAWKCLEKPGKYTVASMLSVAPLTLIFMSVHNKVRIFFIDCVSVEGVYCKMSQKS